MGRGSSDVIAGGIQFRDGSVMMFSEMEPPVAGSVLVYGGSAENSGFLLPTDSEMMYSEDVDWNLAPAAPTALSLSYDMQEVFEGDEPRAVIHATWTAPVLDEDGNSLEDLDYCRVEYSADDIDYMPVAEVKSGQTQEAYITDLPTGVTYYVRVVAVDKDYNDSSPVSNSIAILSTPSPDNVSNVALSVQFGFMLVGTWDACSDPSLWGYAIQIARSSNAYSDGGTPSGWEAWSSDFFYPSRDGQSIEWTASPSLTGYWYKIQVKALLLGGVRSASWVESSSYVALTGITADGLSTGTLNAEIAELVGSGAVYIDSSGMVCKDSKFIFYSNDGTTNISVLKMGTFSGDPMLAAYDASGSKVAVGKVGTFWGLYIENGMINVTTASGKVLINSTGISGYVSTEVDPRFKLDSTGLVLRKANIYLTSGGVIDLIGAGAASSVRLSSSGIVIKNSSGTTIGTFTYTGITLGNGTTIDLLGAGAASSIRLSSSGIVIKNSSGVTIGTINTTGISFGSGTTITGGTITGGTIQTATSGQRVVLSSTYNNILLYDDFSTYAAGVIRSNAGGMELESPYHTTLGSSSNLYINPKYSTTYPGSLMFSFDSTYGYPTYTGREFVVDATYDAYGHVRVRFGESDVMRGICLKVLAGSGNELQIRNMEDTVFANARLEKLYIGSVGGMFKYLSSYIECRNYLDSGWCGFKAGTMYTSGTLVTSDETLKRDITPYGRWATMKLKSTPVKWYNLLEDEPDRIPRLGWMVGDMPKEAIGPDGVSYDPQAMLAIAWKAIQELSEEVDLLKKGMV